MERFLRARWLALTWKLDRGKEVLDRIRILNREALAEFAHPGLAAERRTALEAARLSTLSLTHPVAADVRYLLEGPGAATWDPLLVRALAAVACHAETGEQLAERVFSAHYLGSSKALARVRAGIERILGRPLEALGIREGAAATFVGGGGRLCIEGREVDLSVLFPFVGLARETLAGQLTIEPPTGGLLLVENFTVFEACCRAEVTDARDSLVIWTAGYPGRGVRSLVDAAIAAQARIRIWADSIWTG